MALKSTIYKATVQIADIDHGYYAEHALTLARHPSETDERMMVRLAALAHQAHKLQSVCRGDGTLAFGAGLSNPDEPDVWLRDFTGRARVWVEVGLPEERPITKACSQADEVLVFAYASSADIWWRGIEGKLARLRNLCVYRIAAEQAQALGGLAERSMQLQATLQDGNLLMSGAAGSVEVDFSLWKG
ncbi:MAG: hypothetical protein RLZZ126_537 [Pseudomonadota bacterium]|jgi:uncharacterized protein YaeQ